MSCIHHRSLLALAASLCLAGCAQMVAIESPLASAAPTIPSTDPRTDIKLRFHNRFVPPFTASLNGNDVTPAFGTCPGRGALCSLTPSSFLLPGGNTLSVTGGSSNQYFDSLTHTVNFRAATLILHSSACPPACVIHQVRETQSITGEVLVPVSPGEVVRVTITPDTGNNRMSLNSQAAGTELVLDIPANDRRASFNIRGIQRGAFTLTAAAKGFAPIDVRFNVAP